MAPKTDQIDHQDTWQYQIITLEHKMIKNTQAKLNK